MSNAFGCWGSGFIGCSKHVNCILNKIFTTGIFNWYLFLGIALVQWNEIVWKIYRKITWINLIHNVAVLEIKLRCWKDGKVLNKLRLLYRKTLLGKLEQCVCTLGEHCLECSPFFSLILHSRILLHKSGCLTIHDLRSSIHDLRFTIQDLRSMIHDPRSTIHDLRSTIHDPISTIHDSRSTIYDPQSTIHYPIHDL